MRAEPSVTASIPYYRGKRYIRRAVASLLRQTHGDLRIVVVNDADPDPPWDELGDFDDPRLIRFSLTRNHGGPFFANAVVLEAFRSPWFMVQEQDDWSAPERAAHLLQAASLSHADFALSAQFFHQERPDGSSTFGGIKWRHTGRSVCPVCAKRKICQRCFVDFELTGEYRYRAPHTGLFRSQALRSMGGYYAGLHLHFDSLLMNLLLMTGRVSHTPIPLYHRVLRADSLTSSKASGFGSSASDRETRIVHEMYRQAFANYQRYLAGDLSSVGLAEHIRQSCQANVSPFEWQELKYEAARLRAYASERQRARAAVEG